MLRLKTILHPTDFSESSAAALQLAGSLARDHGARLVILHVVPIHMALANEAMPIPMPAPELGPLREQLEKLRPEDPMVSVRHVLVEGDPVWEILRVAKDNDCDMIVMGTHGRRALSRLLLGSVAEQVLRQANCPVVTLKSLVGGNQPEQPVATGADREC